MKKNKIGVALLAGVMMAGNVGGLMDDTVCTAFAEENKAVEEKEFAADVLTAEAWDTATGDMVDGKLEMTFSKQYDQLLIRLPEEIDLSICESVTFYIENQTIPLSFKLWSGSNEIMAEYEKSNESAYTFYPNSQEVIDAVGIMITADSPSDAKATLTGVKFTLNGEREQASIEEDIPAWKDAITGDLCDIAGACISQAGMKDDTLMQLVTKHYNAITPENELKPESLLGGAAPSVSAGTAEMITFNDKELLVPKELHFGNAEEMLDKIVEWNEANPDNFIRVRGHVLVWHSQTPEWFFYEDFNVAGELASPETMNLRMEWYIKNVLEHFTGEDSKYKDLFYGWDVVNEAVSDASGSYRKASENSMWAKVYGDENPEYIVNAFVYANKYAPETLELYYNDYNDTVDLKCSGIVKLLKAVKDTEGARISAMGMQGHYDMMAPTGEQVEKCAREYAAVVGKIQLTELDMKASGMYDGTDATRDEVYTKMAYRYKDIYDALKRLKDSGVEVGGITFWGIVDKNSWLNDQASVGGGANGTDKQCPVLFDNDYKAKPSFWAFVDPGMLNPATKNIVVMQTEFADFSKGMQYDIEGENVSASFIPVCDPYDVKVEVVVKDTTADEDDMVTVFCDSANTKSDGASVVSFTTKRSDAEEIDGGYKVEFSFPVDDLVATKQLGFDLKVQDGKNIVSFNDTNNEQEKGSKNYAYAVVKPTTEISKGTVSVDGEIDSVWDAVEAIPLTINLGSKVSCDAKLLWDENNLYVLADVKDDVLNSASEDDYQQDSLEVFIDENNGKTTAYESDDKQYRVNYLNNKSFNGEKCVDENVTSVAKETEEGYVIEAAFKWTEGAPSVNQVIGLELQINDADASGKRSGTLSWYDETGTGWSSPAVFGNATLVETQIASSTNAKPDDLNVEVSAPKKDEEKSNTTKYVVICMAVLAVLVAAFFGLKKKSGKNK